MLATLQENINVCDSRNLMVCDMLVNIWSWHHTHFHSHQLNSMLATLQENITICDSRNLMVCDILVNIWSWHHTHLHSHQLICMLATLQENINICDGRNLMVCDMLVNIWSWHHTTIWLKSFWALSQPQKYKLYLVPLRQGSHRENYRTTGNNFWRGMCPWGLKNQCSPKTRDL